MKFLFDLFPILLFFVAFKLSNIYVATGVAIAATLIQVAWMAFRHRKVDAMLWVSLALQQSTLSVLRAHLRVCARRERREPSRAKLSERLSAR